MDRTICKKCNRPMFLHGLPGTRPLFACGCGYDLLGSSSYDGCVAWTLDPESEDENEQPELRFVTGEDLAWGNWVLAQREIDALLVQYPHYAERFG